MEKIKNAIEYLKKNKVEKDQGIEYLKGCTDLSGPEKNLVFAYVYPRPLGDYELPSRVQNHRKLNGRELGYPTSDLPETTLILEAGQTEQYGRFIKHLFHAFCDPAKIFTVDGEDTADCAICGKVVSEFGRWSKEFPEDSDKEHLAFGSTDSGIILCLDCLIQLMNAKEIMDFLDPGFFDWTKRK